MEDKTLSIRMVKMKTNIGTKQGGKYYKSYKQQMEHDFRIEDIEKNYLKRPNEKNKYYKFEGKNLQGVELNDIEKLWENVKNYHLKNKKKKLDKQTKPTINFLLSFSKDFDLSEEDRIKQMESVKDFITKNYSLPIYLVQHNDEKALHYSFSIMNYDFKTQRPIAKQINTSQLQDNITNHLKQNNQDYGHNRGIKKNISLKEHKTIMQGKVEEESKKLEILENQIEELILKNKKLDNQNEELILKNKKLENQNDSIKSEQDNLKQTLFDGIENLEKLSKDFVEFGIKYKGKDIDGVFALFQRYLDKDKQEDINKMFNKIQKQIDNSKKQLSINNKPKIG
jgi:hypothetical protein